MDITRCSGSSPNVLPTLHLGFYAHLTSSLDIYLRLIKRPAAPLFSLESLEHLCRSIFFSFQDAVLRLDTRLRTSVLSLSRVSQPAASHSAILSIPYVLAPAPLGKHSPVNRTSWTLSPSQLGLRQVGAGSSALAPHFVEAAQQPTAQERSEGTQERHDERCGTRPCSGTRSPHVRSSPASKAFATQASNCLNRHHQDSSSSPAAPATLGGA